MPATRLSILLLMTLLFDIGFVVAQTPDREVRGQLLNAVGQPVPDAKIVVRAVSRGSGTRYGDTGDVESSTTTDVNGEFVVHGKDSFKAVTITAEAEGYAKGIFTELTTGEEMHALTMLEGVTVAGTVVKDGQAIAAVKIGLCDTDRNSKIFTVDLSATTDDQGHFQIAHVPPKRDYYLFGYMHSFADKGALPSRKITTLADGSTLELGDLKVDPAFVLEGRLSIQLPHLPILISRYHGRDALTGASGPLGQFHFAGVPAEIVTVSVDAPGYQLSLQNASLDPSDPTHLLGRVVTNKTDLVIDIEPGAGLQPLNISTAAAEEPLRGSEPPTAGLNTIKVTGIVTDAQTGEKLPSFITTEGRVNHHRYDWFFTRAQRHKDGDFTTFLTGGENPPILVVQADDHLPWVSAPVKGATNFNIELKKGVHPKGIVLKPDGQRATNVTVYLASTNFGHTRIENFGVENTAQWTRTDAHGKFSFAPQVGAVAVMVFDDAGFTETPIDDLLKSGEVRLKALARVEGKLLIGSAPGANEVIYLSTAPAPFHWYPLELPAYSITFTTRTDTNGNFVFDRVPPTWMEIAHSPDVKIVTASGAELPTIGPAGAFRLTQTQRILPAPGETLHVTLGGKGRVVTGRVEITGAPSEADWRGSPQSMELIVAHEGPSDAAMKAFLEKLSDAYKPGASAAQRKAAEKAYQAERKSFALATQKYFGTERGREALLAEHRYFLNFDSEGAFKILDVPPGKYRIMGLISSSDPSAFAFDRRFVGKIEAEITVPEGDTPFDLGVIKATPIKRPKK